MEFTGERYIPELDWPEISYEHWHRYLFAESCAKDKTVLDVACGEGYGTHRLAHRAAKVVGVDLNEATIAHARLKYTAPNLEFLQGSADAIPISGSAIFDVITSFETIEHIDEIAQQRFLSEVKRLLKPTGVFLISTPNKLEYTDLPRYQNEFHIKEFYQNEFAAFLGSKFRSVSILGQRVYPASCIWPIDQSGEIEECQIAFRNGSFAPTERDEKTSIYFLAVATDEPAIQPRSSFLIDVTSRAIAHRSAELFDQMTQLRSVSAQLDESRRQIDTLKRKLAELDRGAEDVDQHCVLLEEKYTKSHENETYLQAALEEVQGSRSWRLAHTIRKLLKTKSPGAD